MPLSARLVALVVGALIAGSALARTPHVTDPALPRSLPGDGAVSVSWTDPAQFAEIRYSGNRWEARRGDWVRKLAEHLQTSAAERLASGERLDIVITDIRRAGSYEPWRGISAQDIRIMRDIYPPRITLNFKRYAADGSVVDAGERKLVDSMYLSSVGSFSSSDPLRYEKHLIDSWIRRDLLSADDA